MVDAIMQRAARESDTQRPDGALVAAGVILCCTLAGCVPLRGTTPEPGPEPAEDAAPPAETLPPEPRDAPATAAVETATEPAPQGEAQPVAAAPPVPAGDVPAAESGVPAESDIAARASSSAPRPRGPLHGSLSLRYRGRFTDDDEDNDLWTLLALDYADEARPWITGHVLGRVDADLDGKSDGDSTFHELDDTFDGAVMGRLYSAYVELAPTPDGELPGTLRIGRQTDPRLPEVLHIDGVSFLSTPLGEKDVELGVYGGIPVHWYESSSEGDWAYGTSVEARPWRGGRARLEWMHLDDEVALGPFHDDLFALGLWQTLAQRWLLEGQYTRLEGDDRDLRLRTQYHDPDSETVARLLYYELRETQAAQALELDPFSEQLQEYFPFRQAAVEFSRPVAEHAVVDVGADLRRMKDESDVGEYNREYERYYLTLTLRELAAAGLALSLTGDEWNGDGRDIGSLGADLSFAPDPLWTASLGTYYSLFKYELYDVGERDDVRTYYLRGSYRASERLSLELSYDYEDDDLEQYHTVRWGAAWRF